MENNNRCLPFKNGLITNCRHLVAHISVTRGIMGLSRVIFDSRPHYVYHTMLFEVSCGIKNRFIAVIRISDTVLF